MTAAPSTRPVLPERAHGALLRERPLVAERCAWQAAPEGAWHVAKRSTFNDARDHASMQAAAPGSSLVGRPEWVHRGIFVGEAAPLKRARVEGGTPVG